MTLPVSVEPAGGEGTELIVYPALAGREKVNLRSQITEFATGMRDNQLFPAFRILAGDGVRYDATRPVVAQDLTIRFPLPEGAVTQPWQAAALLNMVDYSTAPLDGDEEFRLADKAILRTDAFAAMPLSGLFSALDALAADSIAWISGIYKPDEDLALEHPSWPGDFERLGVEAVLTYEKPVDAKTAEALKGIAADLELMMAWSAFQTGEMDMDYWTTTLVPYPAGRESKTDTFKYWVEAPAGNPAITLYLLSALAAQRYGVSIVAGEFEFTDIS